MDARKAGKLREEVASLRKRLGNIRDRELISLAKRIGRREFDRGKEPTFVRAESDWNPLTIPKHPRALKKGTAKRILDQLEADIDAREEEGPEDEDEGAPVRAN